MTYAFAKTVLARTDFHPITNLLREKMPSQFTLAGKNAAGLSNWHGTCICVRGWI